MAFGPSTAASLLGTLGKPLNLSPIHGMEQ